MAKKTIEEIRIELEDELKSLNYNKLKLIQEVQSIEQKQNDLLEKLYLMDPRFVRITCNNCKGTGYVEAKDGKKQFCPYCGGPDKPYIWAEAYEDTQ